MTEITADDVIACVPTRKYRGEIVPLAPYKEILRLLALYRFTPKELEILKAEVEHKKNTEAA